MIDESLYIPKGMFQRVLPILTEKGYLGQDEKKRWEKLKVLTSCKEYREEAEKNKDSKKALYLAHYYRGIATSERDKEELFSGRHPSKDLSCVGEAAFAKAITWLCKAQTYLGKTNIDEQILQKFFRSIPQITSPALFTDAFKHIADAAAASPDIQSLYFNLTTRCDRELTKCIGAFLVKNRSVTNVYLNCKFADFEGKLSNANIGKSLKSYGIACFSALHAEKQAMP